MNNLNFVEMFFIEKYLYYGSTQDDEFVNGIAVIKSENDIVLEDEIIRKAMFYLYKSHSLFRTHVHLDAKY